MNKCSWSYFTLRGVTDIYLVAGENFHCQKLIKTQGKLETFKKLPDYGQFYQQSFTSAINILLNKKGE